MKDLKYGYIKNTLEFNFDARTSRGSMKTHASYLIWVMHPSDLNAFGWGEAAPLPGLSPEAGDDFEELLNAILELLNEGHLLHDLDMNQAPSVRFAVECAQLDLWNGAQRILFDNSFSSGTPIPINGLVWMSTTEHMLEQAIQKAQSGYNCIKFKVGALDFDAECRMLEMFRKKFLPSQYQIRLDANGAFDADHALEKLKELSRFSVHSLEQPVKPKQYDLMEELCARSLVPIALDEELIGLDPESEGKKFLQKIKPAFLVLKPTLLGGLQQSARWIRKAEEHECGWWATSALESNVGLNAIAQWVSVHKYTMPQGLGTGSLYSNNIDSPLLAESGALHYIAGKDWRLPNPF